ncbi:MAG: Rne/Rng family ribonuclease [Candidatus Dadabacteria bacterium]|nr:MAG: Rne/Rng family ribonuclease [Candidatus Dadabacteria bacterium]
MKDSLILVHSIPFETRVAVIEDGRLAELFLEADDERPLVGNIIKGRVSRVLPGMQAAFVEIGLEKAGFLYAGDVVSELEDLDGDEDRGPRRGEQSPRIEDVVREGQEILVQITKAPIGTKGARLTNFLTLPGRHLVLSPDQRRIGVSRKIRFAKERARLRAILRDIAPDDMGLIGRTAAEGRTREELQADRDYLVRLWDTVQRRARKASAPATVYSELTMPLRVIRDVLSDRYAKILVDDPDEFERIRKFLESAIPKRANDVELYQGRRPMLDVYGVERQMRAALRPTVELPSGGSIVIEETEALTSIDVNTGRFVGKSSLEDTVLQTNLEAAEEISRQLRLRNIGGIIIIDFIDMDLPENRTKIYNRLKELFRNDRAKSGIQKISDLGLVEMTRQRLQESLTRSIGHRCPHCFGRGYLSDPRLLAGDLYRKLQEAIRATDKPTEFVIRAHPWLADYLFDEILPYFESLELDRRCRIRILPDEDLAEEQFEIDSRAVAS